MGEPLTDEMVKNMASFIELLADLGLSPTGFYYNGRRFANNVLDNVRNHRADVIALINNTRSAMSTAPRRRRPDGRSSGARAR